MLEYKIRISNYAWHQYVSGSVQNISYMKSLSPQQSCETGTLLFSFYSWENREKITSSLSHGLRKIKTQTVCLWRPCSKHHLALPGFPMTENLPCQPGLPGAFFFMWMRNKPQACLALAILSCLLSAAKPMLPDTFSKWFPCLRALVPTSFAWNALPLYLPLLLLLLCRPAPCSPICLPSQRVHLPERKALVYSAPTNLT